MHILLQNFRSNAQRTFGTPVLRCSFFEQTALFYESPIKIFTTFCGQFFVVLASRSETL